MEDIDLETAIGALLDGFRSLQKAVVVWLLWAKYVIEF
jgi:hypothetical protein